MLEDTRILSIEIWRDDTANAQEPIALYWDARPVGRLAEMLGVETDDGEYIQDGFMDEEAEEPLPDNTSWMLHRARLLSDTNGRFDFFRLNDPDWIDVTNAASGKN